MSKIVAIIQARMGSTRLPGKVLKTIVGKTALTHLIERVKKCNSINSIIVATTIKTEDDLIYQEACNNQIKVFRGSEEDVLSRYYFAAIENHADVIVRITADCPLFDPNLLEVALNEYFTRKHDVVRIGVSGGFPRGLDAEIFSFKLLEEAFHKADKEYFKEHVTPYIYENYSRIFSLSCDNDYSHYRITLDTEEDFQVIDEIFKGLYEDYYGNFYFKHIIEFLKKNPDIANINSHIEQKKN